jgi:hypothetical protein
VNPPPSRSTPSAWLLGKFTTLKLSSDEPRAPCCYLHLSVTPLGDFTTRKLSSCAPSSSKPSGLLLSSSQAVCSRAPDLSIATFDHLGNFTTLRLSSCAPSSSMVCALELHAVRIATFDLLGNFTTLRLSSCAPSSPTPSASLLSSSKPSMLLPLSFPENPPPSRFQVLCIATPLSSSKPSMLSPLSFPANPQLSSSPANLSPPPPRWPSHLISLASGPGLYRPLCGGIVHPKSVNLSLWTFFAIEIWWRYGWKWSLPPPQMAITPYISRIWPRPLPSIMRLYSTPLERQFKPMDVTRNQDLVEIWIEMLAAPPLPRWPSHLISLAFDPGLYRRLCGGIVHPKSVNLSLWTSLAIKIWWRYGLRCSPPPNGQHTSHLTPAFTDDDAAEYYSPRASV